MGVALAGIAFRSTDASQSVEAPVSPLKNRELSARARKPEALQPGIHTELAKRALRLADERLVT